MTLGKDHIPNMTACKTEPMTILHLWLHSVLLNFFFGGGIGARACFAFHSGEVGMIFYLDFSMNQMR